MSRTIPERLAQHTGLICTEVLAQYLGVNPETLRRYARKFQIPHVRAFGKLMFDPTEILTWYQKRHIS
jgi:predicted site-specific integrase-resolvase